MSIERLHPDPLIDALVADLGSVAPRRPAYEVLLIAGLIGVELLLFVTLRTLRPDMPAAMATPAFWWKSGAFAVIAVLAAAAMLVSLDPAAANQRRSARLWRWLGLAAPLALALGWLIDAGASDRAALLARLQWREGVDCLLNVGLLSLPLVLLLGVLMRRGDHPAGAHRGGGGPGGGGVRRGDLCLALPARRSLVCRGLVWRRGAGGCRTGAGGVATPDALVSAKKRRAGKRQKSVALVGVAAAFIAHLIRDCPYIAALRHRRFCTL